MAGATMASIPDWRHAKKALSQVRTVSGARTKRVAATPIFRDGAPLPRWRMLPRSIGSRAVAFA